MDFSALFRKTFFFQGEAKFDFEGTGPEVYSSCNAPPAVTMAAVIYCLRCLVGSEIPLNQGCLAPISVGFISFNSNSEAHSTLLLKFTSRSVTKEVRIVSKDIPF